MTRRCLALSIVVTSAVAVLLTPATIAQTIASGAPSFVVRNVTVFDGERSTPATNVIVDGGLIRFVGGSVPTRWGALPSIDGGGGTLLPGLIDSHTHTWLVSQLNDAARFGVTTVLDLWTVADLPALRQAAATRTDVADIRSADILATVPGGHGTEMGNPIPTVSGPDAAESFVAARVANGADYLKIVLNGVRAKRGMPTMNAATARALVEAGHRHGLLVVAHIENLDDVRTAVEAGVDGLAHNWRDGGDAPEVAKLLADRHIFVITTLSTPDGFIPGTGAALAADPRLKPFLSHYQVGRLTGEIASPLPGPKLRDIDSQIAGVRSLVRAGVTILAGTDPPNGTVLHGVSLHRELELLVQSGLTAAQALTAATLNPAVAFHLRDRGRIAVGARADLVLLRGDPTSNITATRDIVRVWRSGVTVPRMPEER